MRKAAVAAIVHPIGTKYWFVETDMGEWSWWEMVAQLDEGYLRYVVGDGDGLVGCEFRPRVGSYDHSRQVQLPASSPQLRCWDFVPTRNDGTAVRLQPELHKRNIRTYPMDELDAVAIPRHGLGMSDGRGTFKL